MQRAARAVELENRLLRALLSHRGVSHDEIEHFLRFSVEASDGGRRGGDGAASGASPCRGLPTPDTRKPLFPGVDAQGMSRPPRTPSQKPSGCGPGAASSAAVAADAGDVARIPQEEPGAHDGDEQDFLARRGDEEQLGVGPAGPKPPPPVAAPHARSVAMSAASPMETLCEAAATIIADVQGHNDRELALAALGCQGTTACTVENMRVFDLIDKTY